MVGKLIAVVFIPVCGFGEGSWRRWLCDQPCDLQVKQSKKDTDNWHRIIAGPVESESSIGISGHMYY